MVIGELTQETDVVVIGGGPGGYVAAIRAADLGLDVTLIEEREKLGGVCLIEGCIPSKTLIHTVELANAMREGEKIGLSFKGDVQIDIEKLRAYTQEVVDSLTGGVKTLVEKRGVDVIHGRATFTSNNKVHIEGAGNVEFKYAIIATGSRINELPTGYDLPLWTSYHGVNIPEIPKSLLVVGGGYIGLELGFVYAGLGSKVTMVEFMPNLLAGADQDLVKVVVKHAEKRFERIMTGSKVQEVKQGKGDNYDVTVETADGKTETLNFDRVLVSIGRKPNTDNIGLEHTDVEVGDRGLIVVNEEGRTSVKNIFAIGDVTPGPALAHKASREGKVVAEVIAKHPAAFDNRAIPAVVFTDPEISWTGITEREAKEKGITVNVGRFPLSALGRAKSLGQTDGFVKVISDPETHLILGVAIVGPSASELIAEGTLAIEMGATLEDLMSTIHPHPTLSESLMEAAEVAAGEPVHILPRKKK
ncbi:dihydrolipoyl dehydrogenase [bacterium]|nr:dihydrolipoyl dehydrogenase [bacterium]